MPENFSPNNLELEIQELQKRIEEKRRLLESESLVIEEKQLVRESVSDIIKETFGPASGGAGETYTPAPSPSSSASPVSAISPASSYLDTIDEETSQSLGNLVSDLPKKGLKKTISEAQNFDAFTLDAFHDLLVDRLYEELKERGIVK